jgi:predicted enzyme related to lactoylglutathione lyase
MEIVLATPDMGHGPDDTESLRMLLAKGALNGVLFTTDNCDAFFERVRATGAEVLQEPIDQPYGVRDCAFRDPAGNHVRIGSPIPQPS